MCKSWRNSLPASWVPHLVSMMSAGQLMSKRYCHTLSAHLVDYDPTSGLACLDSVQLCIAHVHSHSQLQWNDLLYVNGMSKHFTVYTAKVQYSNKFYVKFKKDKVAHTWLPSIGFQSWSWLLAVSLQVTWVINPVVLPLLSARPAITPATLKRAATNFAAWWTEAQWVWTVCLRLLPDSVQTAIWTHALLRLSPAC